MSPLQKRGVSVTAPARSADPRCVACGAISDARTQEELFFRAYVSGIDDAGSAASKEHWMCPAHQGMRERILEELEKTQ